VFAVDNPVTKELFFCFPVNPGGDAALRYDYRFNTVSTTSMAISAGCAVQRPEGEIVPVQAEDWFVMGIGNGLYRYGRVNEAQVNSGAVTCSKAKGSLTVVASAGFFNARMTGKSILTSNRKLLAIAAYIDPTHVTVIGDANLVVASQGFKVVSAIYHRDGQGYDGVLQSGLQALAGEGETWMNGYVPVLSSDSPDTPLQVMLRGGLNPSSAKDICGKTVTNPQTSNLVPVAVAQRYVGDRLKVSGVNHLVEVVSRVFRATGVGSESFNRRS
jgi:hypothetical protein